jgi:hypothetical protein
VADPEPVPPTGRPRVPAYAWAWLQRSRPVLDELARQLTGQLPTPTFLDDVRQQYATDPFVRDVLIGVVADVAFGGRLPTRRPAGTAWDRGLTWWAAAVAGTSPAEFEARSGPSPVSQPPLFDAGPGGAPRPHSLRTAPVAAVPLRRPAPAAAALAAALRDLLSAAEGDRIPASAVRQLLAELEGR